MTNRGLKLVLAVGLMLASGGASADPRDDVLGRAARCNTITEYRVWLDCYYGAAQPMRSILGLPPAPPAQTQLVPDGSNASRTNPNFASPQTAAGPPPLPRRKSTGILGELVGGALVVNKIRASALSFDKACFFTVTLADGEIWRQDPGDARLAKWPEAPSRYLVTVREGALNTYNLSMEDESVFYKVRRVH